MAVDERVTQASAEVIYEPLPTERVTQASAEVIFAADSHARVTKAWWQTAMQAEADARVTTVWTQQLLEGPTADARVTKVWHQVMFAEPRPSTPFLFSPANGSVVVGDTMTVYHSESFDPDALPLTYDHQYRKVGDVTWIVAFTGRSGNDPFDEDVTGLPNGDYENQTWADNGTKQSLVAENTFVLNHGAPEAPNITAPLTGTVWDKVNPNTVTWDAAVDPDMDVLTYSAQYRALGSSTWISLFTGKSALFHDWDHTSFAEDDYELEVWAHDGTSDGLHDYVVFEINTGSQPSAPLVKILTYNDRCVTPAAKLYEHVKGVAWKSTTIQIFPEGGDPANPTISVVITDPNFQLGQEVCGLAPGFRGEVRMAFTDINDVTGPWSFPAPFQTVRPLGAWSPRWDITARWGGGGSGPEGKNRSPHGGSEQRPAALVNLASEGMGSVFLRGEVMLEGCHCGWGGKDTELRQAGIGTFQGYEADNTDFGVWAWLQSGINAGPAVGQIGADFWVAVRWPTGQLDSWKVNVDRCLVHVITEYYTVYDRKPWYPIEIEIQRTVGASPTTRVRARIFRSGEEDDVLREVATGEWHHDHTVARLGPCGRAGVAIGQLGIGIGSSVTQFRNLEWAPIRDLGLTEVVNDPPLTPVGPGAPPACTPATEAAATDPVFYPAPPNGEVPVRETISWPTDVIDAAEDDTEQRVQLREVPKIEVGWTSTLPTGREASEIQALVWDSQAERWGVPMWMDGAMLLVDLAQSASTIPAASLDVTGKRFDEVNYVAIWTDQHTWDFIGATLEVDDSITLDTPTTQDFAAGESIVLPVRIGRMPSRVEMPRAAPWIGEFEVSFVLESMG